MSKVIIYARTSGNDAERDSLRNQENACLKYANEKGYTIIETIKEDVGGISGTEFDAPGLNKAIKYAEQGLYDVLLVRDTSRFARGDIENDMAMFKVAYTELQLRQNGVTVEYVWQNYTNDLAGKFLKAFDQLRDADERSRIEKRLTAGRRSRVEYDQSMMVHGYAPYGYRVEREGRRLKPIVVETEAKIIKLIFDWYVNKRWSLNRIVKQLRSDKVPTYAGRRGIKPFAKKGAPIEEARQSKWHSSTVARILANQTYTGTWIYAKRKIEKEYVLTKNGKIKTVRKRVNNPDDYLLEVKVPRLISDSLYEEAQKRLEQNKQMMGQRSSYDYLMARRLTCDCGKQLIVRTSRHGKYMYYRCGECGNHYRADKLVDPFCWQWLEKLLSDRDLLRRKIDDYLSQQEDELKEAYDKLASIDELRTAKRNEYDKLIDLYLSSDDFGQEQLLGRKQMVENELKEYEIAYQKFKAQIDEANSTMSGVRHFIDSYENAGNPDSYTGDRYIQEDFVWDENDAHSPSVKPDMERMKSTYLDLAVSLQEDLEKRGFYDTEKGKQQWHSKIKFSDVAEVLTEEKKTPSFERKLNLVNQFDLNATISTDENNVKWIQLRCTVDESALLLLSLNQFNHVQRAQNFSFDVTEKLRLDFSSLPAFQQEVGR